MSLLTSFPHQCTIRRRVRTKDTYGGSSDSTTNEQTGVTCWEQPLNSREIHDFQKRGISVDRKIYFLADPGVTERHQILITSRDGVTVASPIPLDVFAQSLPDATAGLGVVYRVYANENSGEDN